jgi:hypothetical protein
MAARFVDYAFRLGLLKNVGTGRAPSKSFGDAEKQMVLSQY